MIECQVKNHVTTLFLPIENTLHLMEENAELIVPDSCPDILRVVDSCGLFCLKETDLQTGNAHISGVVRASILYVPENGRGIKKLEIQVPLSGILENPLFNNNCHLVVHPVCCVVHARIANPRKLSIHVQVKMWIRSFQQQQLCLPEGIESENEYGIECQKRKISFNGITTMCKKSFSLSEEFDLPVGKPALESIVRAKISFQILEKKMIGGKVVLKGITSIEILYLGESDENGVLSNFSHEIPFSQVIELATEEDNLETNVSLYLSGAELYGIEGEDGKDRSISVTLNITAQVCTIAQFDEMILTDFYSTKFQVHAAAETIAIPTVSPATMVRTSVRETLETGTTANELMDLSVVCEEVRCRPEEKTLTCDMVVSALYRGEDYQIYGLAKRIQVMCPVDTLSDTSQYDAISAISGDLLGTPTTEGIDVRFPVEFSLIQNQWEAYTIFDQFSLEEIKNEEKVKPSLLLRRVQKGESLWTIAKKCRTPEELLRQANALSDDTVEEGRMLLIPCRQ